MKSTIFYIGNFDRPELNAAGKRVYGNALILEKLGYKVVLIGKTKEPTLTTNPIQYGDKMVFYSFPNVRLTKTDVFISFLSKVISYESKPSIIIRYGTLGLALFDDKLNSFCKKENIKIVADVVDWLPSCGGSLFFRVVKSIDTFIEKAVFNKKSDGIIAISSYLETYYKRAGCKTVVIPPLVHQYIDNTTNNSSIRLVYAGVPFRFGRMVKKTSEVKDRIDLTVEVILEAAKRGVDVNLEIYGITEDEYLVAYPKHKVLLEGNKITRSVVFRGRKEMIEVQNIVNRADFTILLRNQNRATMAGFPTKVVESISCGTPVITTKTSDLDKYIINGENGFLVNIEEPEFLVQEMLDILALNREDINKMKFNCFKNKQFHFEKFETVLSRFLDEIEGEQ